MTGSISRYPVTVLAAVFAASFAILFVLMDRYLNIYDEGLILVDAVRAMAGDVIHRDYYVPYGPASIELLAALFRLDPHWFLLGRVYGVAIMAGIVTGCFGLLAPRTRPAVTLLFTAFAGLWMVASPVYLYPLFPCLLLALIGTALLLRWLERREAVWLAWAGAVTGLAALFRYDAGVFLGLAQGATVAIALWQRPAARWLAPVARAALPYAAGMAVVFGPVALWFLHRASPSDFAADIINYPLHYYARMRGIPFPRPRELLHDLGLLGVYLPLAAVAGGVVALAARRGAAWAVSDRRRPLLLAATLLATVFYYKGVVRVSPLHMMMAIVPSLLVAALLVDRALDRRPDGRAIAILLVGLFGVPPAVAALHQLAGAWHEGRLLLNRVVMAETPGDRTCAPSADMAFAWAAPNYRHVADYLRLFSRPDEAVYVGLRRHDRVFVNAVALYFYAGRRPGTHWHQFDPGLQTRADIQTAMIADLRRHDVRWLVRDAGFEEVIEPNESSRSSGVHLLDDFLARRYRPVAVDDHLQVWLRRDVAAPPASALPACLKTSGLRAL